MQTQQTPQGKLFDLDNQMHTSSDFGIIHYRYRNGVAQQRIGFGHWTKRAKVAPQIILEEEPKRKIIVRFDHSKATPQLEIGDSTHNLNISDPSGSYTPSTGLTVQKEPSLKRMSSGY